MRRNLYRRNLQHVAITHAARCNCICNVLQMMIHLYYQIVFRCCSRFIVVFSPFLFHQASKSKDKLIKTLWNQIFFVYLHCNYKERDMVDQLHTLFAAMVNKTNVDVKLPLVRTGLAIMYHTPDVSTSQMPLSAFNVLLSENHGKSEYTGNKG